jgi:hypothetical protein
MRPRTPITLAFTEDTWTSAKSATNTNVVVGTEP